MKVTIRNIKDNEFFETENLTRETFCNLYNPGCAEHYILHRFRQSDAYVKQLDHVLLVDNKIIGHIISTKAKVVNDNNEQYDVLHLGPFSIDAEYQNKGLGTELIKHSIEEARKLGFKSIILFGKPDYYSRFGFLNAKEYEITTQDGLNFDPFMALELETNSLSEVKGKFYLHKSAEIDKNRFQKFDKKFPKKEKGEPMIKIQ